MFAVCRRYKRAPGNVIRVIKRCASLQEITAVDHLRAGKTGKRDMFTGRTLEPFFLVSMFIDWFMTTGSANCIISKVPYYTEITLPTIVVQSIGCLLAIYGLPRKCIHALCDVTKGADTCPVLRPTPLGLVLSRSFLR